MGEQSGELTEPEVEGCTEGALELDLDAWVDFKRGNVMCKGRKEA